MVIFGSQCIWDDILRIVSVSASVPILVSSSSVQCMYTRVRVGEHSVIYFNGVAYFGRYLLPVDTDRDLLNICDVDGPLRQKSRFVP